MARTPRSMGAARRCRCKVRPPNLSRHSARPEAGGIASILPGRTSRTG